MTKLGKFILGSYEYDSVTELAYQSFIDDRYNTDHSLLAIDTGISYNNANDISRLLKRYPQLKVVSKIAPQMYHFDKQLILHHLEELGRDHIDLMLIHNNRFNWIPIVATLKDLKMQGRIHSIGVSNFTVDDLKRYKLEIGEYPEYNEMEINPLYTNLEVIDFCRENDIKLIAYCVLGGKYKADFLIKTFTLPGLINYAGYYADHVIIRSDNSDHLKNCWRSYDANYVPDRTNTNDKVMVPMNYIPQANMGLVKGKVMYQVNQRCSRCIPMKDAVDAVINYPDYEIPDEDLFRDSIESLEFISDIRVYLRYHLNDLGVRTHQEGEVLIDHNDQRINVYIIDGKGNLSKVHKPDQGYRVLFKLV